jgi:hypothetical protein
MAKGNNKNIIHNIRNILRQHDLKTYNEKTFLLNRQLIILKINNEEYIPVIDGVSDGNSLFSAISILLCGNESRYNHVRLAIVYALIELEKSFKDNSEFQKLVTNTATNNFHDDYHLEAAAKFLDKPLRVYKFEDGNYIQDPIFDNSVNYNNKQQLMIARQGSHFIPLLQRIGI